MAWQGNAGTIVETFRDKTGVIFEWIIPDILSMLATKSGYYTSDSLKFRDSIWYLCIYPKSKTWTSKWITMALMRTNLEISTRVSIRIKNADGLDEKVTSQRAFPKNEYSFVFAEFLHSSELVNRKSQIAPSDALTLICAIWKDDPPISLGHLYDLSKTRNEFDAFVRHEERAVMDMKCISTLRKHLKNLLCSADDHDVIIKVKDREFGAQKCILRARSKVFDDMFRHNFADDSIAIDDCDPDAFSEFLHYIYTGQVEDLSPSKAVELYNTAAKYDVSCLKEECLLFLKGSLTVAVICDVIALATKHQEFELLKQATHFFMEHNREILATSEWLSFLRTNPDEATELYIKSFETVHGNANDDGLKNADVICERERNPSKKH